MNDPRTSSTTGEAWQPGKLLRCFAWFICAYIIVLIFLGGQVKSHEAGLSVPDWPLTYGQNPITYPVSEWKGGIFYEHLHRLVAGAAGCLSLALCIWLFVARAPKRHRVVGCLTVVAVIAQAVLGGMTVWYQLPVLVSSSHATLAQTYLLLHVILAYSLTAEYRRRKEQPHAIARDGRAFRLALGLIALIYVQLLLGAVMRHTESGLAIPDFPTTAGSVVPRLNAGAVDWVNDWRLNHELESGAHLPPVTLGQLHIHFAHRAGAFVVAGYILFLWWWLRKNAARFPLAAEVSPWLVGLVAVQVLLGATVIWTTRLPIITSIHVATGATILAVAGFLALRAWPGRSTAAAPQPREADAASA
jgi:cytochrome c oxidase assembly protein subunit 15